MKTTIKIKSVSKLISMLLFMMSYFFQSFIDGYYIAHDMNPVGLKMVKYAIFLIGIIFGFIAIREKKKFCFLKETQRIIIAISCFLILSLILMMMNGGELGVCIELIFRFSTTILYAFVLLNVLEFDEIYKMMVYLLFISIWGWLLEKGSMIFSMQNIMSISFADSTSPFESSYFAAASVNCCAFFMYYRKNKFLSALSFIFVLITFKRPAIVFSFLFLILPLLINVNTVITKKILFFGKTLIVLATIGYYYLLLPQNEKIIYKLTGDSASHLTQGRSMILRKVIDSGYSSAGLGSTNNIAGHIIEMDLIQFMLEMTLIGLIIFVFCYTYSAGQNLYAVLVMLFQMVTCLTGSGLYNSFGWLPVFLMLGCINYKQEVEPCKRLSIRRIRRTI